ncbi:hypothetical protein [Streptomyces sp. NPDC088925]|uniref:hypothetical protein n=1 Tax=Streptomyces sp. NPDC088925 TaxID=3365914 RepID=UPI003808E343
MDLPDDLLRLQRAADEAHAPLPDLEGEEWVAQRAVWFAAAVEVQAAVTVWAREQGANRYEVEVALRRATRHADAE